jgi:hypothetical protein
MVAEQNKLDLDLDIATYLMPLIHSQSLLSLLSLDRVSWAPRSSGSRAPSREREKMIDGLRRAFIMRGWMVMSNLITTETLRRVEQYSRVIVEADIPDSFKDQNHKLYFALVMLPRGHAQTLPRSATVGSSVEAWRTLVHRYERSDPQTQMNLLQVILKFETGDDLMKIMERLSEFEVLVDKYESIPGAE